MNEVTFHDAFNEAARNNVHKKQVGFAIVVVYERESDKPFAKIATRNEEGDQKLAALLRGLVEQF